MFCLQAKIYLKSIDESEVAALTSAVSTSMPSPSARDKDTGATNTSNDDAGGIKSPTMAKPGGLSVGGGVGIGIKSPAMKNAAEENIVRRRRTQQESIASEISLARLILDVGESVSAAAKALNPKPAGDPTHAHANPGSTTTRSKAKGKGKGKGKGGKGGADDDGVVSEAEYQAAMTPFTYDSHENLSDGHAYAKEAAAVRLFFYFRTGNLTDVTCVFFHSQDLRNGPHISRVAKEIAGLAGGALPLNRSSSVFVRIDDAKSVVWSIMITGPEDTPYDGGCFIFGESICFILVWEIGLTLCFSLHQLQMRFSQAGTLRTLRRSSSRRPAAADGAPTLTCTRTARCAYRCWARGRVGKARRGIRRCRRCCRLSYRSNL